MAIDLTKLPGDLIIGVDELNKKFQKFAGDMKSQNESIRMQEAKDRAMNTEAVRQAIAEQGQRQAELQANGLGEDEARHQARQDSLNTLNDQTQQIYENDLSGADSKIGATFSMMTGKIDSLLGVSEKANKLAEFRNDVAKKGLVQTIKDNREAKKAAEKDDALEESSGGGIGTKISDVAGKAFEPLKNVFGGLKAVFLGAVGIFVPLLAFFKALENPKFREIVFSLLDFGKKVFKESLQTIIDVFSSLIDTITNIVDKFKIIFDGDTSLSEKFTALFGIFGDIGKFIFDAIDTITENLLNVFGLSFDPYDGLASWIVGKVGEVFTTIKNWFAEKVEFIVDTYTNIKDWIVDKVTTAFSSISDFFSGIAEFAVDGFTSLKDWVLDKVSLPVAFIKDLFSWPEDGNIGTVFMKLLDLVYAPLNLAINFVKGLFKWGDEENNSEPFKLSDFLFGEDGIISKAIDWIKNLFSFELPDFRDFLPRWLGGKGKDLEDYEPEAGTAGDMAGEAAMENAATDTQTQLEKLLQLDEKAAKEQYEALMKKMEANEELTADEQQFIQQINVVKGGDSVSTNSSTGFSTRKLPFNDDPTTQALTTSYP